MDKKDNDKQTEKAVSKKTVEPSEPVKVKAEKDLRADKSTTDNDDSTINVTKAGKRSKKSQEEQAEKEKKIKRKDSSQEQQPALKQTKKPPRSRVERSGKKYRKLSEFIQADKEYPLADAVELAKKTNPAKFDATVELHINLNVDPKQAEQNIRGSLVLPAGTGKELRVAVFADSPQKEEALKAGADIAGTEELKGQLDKQQINFDVLICSPQNMQQLSKYARFLGPRGLMPNPKSGTVASNISKAVEEAKSGKIEYRTDNFGIVHLATGKVSFDSNKLLQNAEAALSSIKSSRPATVKGNFINSVYLTTSMGPSIKVSI